MLVVFKHKEEEKVLSVSDTELRKDPGPTGTYFLAQSPEEASWAWRQVRW